MHAFCINIYLLLYKNVYSLTVQMVQQQLPLSHPKYRPDIDGLRAVAVLAVVAFHAFPSWITGGFIGVDVFFVISGYLISTIIFENLDRGQFSFAEFYARRIRRIFPALLLVLIACLAFGWFALLADEYKQLGKHIAAGAGFISNFTLWNELGYFDNLAETKPLLHLWSLGIEEQFYIIWPLLLWLAWKLEFNLLTITIIVTIASFILNIKGIKQDMIATFYSPQTRFWELLSGSLLAWVALYKKDAFSNFKHRIKFFLPRFVYGKKQETDGKTLLNALSFLGLLLLVYGFWRINKELTFPGQWALVPVLGAVLIITAGSTAWVNRIILSNRVFVWFGLISFPLYLWHWPILTFARIVEGEELSHNIRIAVVSLSILLAWLTYKFVEQPLRFGKYIKAKVIGLSMLMAVVGCIGWYMYKNDGVTSYNLPLKHISDAKNDWGYPKDLKVQANGLLSTSERKPTILFFGDSHVEQFGPRIVNLYQKGLIEEVGFLTQGGCAPIPNSFRNTSGVKGCPYLFSNFEKVLAENPIQTIILGGSYSAYYRNNEAIYLDNGSLHRFDEFDGRAKSMNGFLKFIKNLNKKYKVVVMSHTPGSHKFRPENFLFNDKRRPFPVEADIVNSPILMNDDLEEEMRNSIEFLGIPFVSQFAKICPNSICLPLTDDGLPKYKDGSHLRPFFVIDQMDIFDKYILKSK
jgi:peptidoglycan/LPS O-acetylase OafA/YrhL